MRYYSAMTRKEWGTLIATILGSGVVFLDGTVVNLALPALSRDFGATFADLQWIVDGYMLSLSALILISGSLGDIFGRKYMYIIGLIAFGIASLFCGFAPNIFTLIVLRVVQGVAAAIIVPEGLAIINTNFPSEKRSMAIGRWAAWSGITTIIGPLVGGYLIQSASWRWIFFINVPIVAACLWLAILYVKESRDERPRSVDYFGGLLTVGYLSVITYGLIEGPTRHWDMLSVSSILLGVLLFAGFVALEARKSDPMVNLRLFASRNFSGANIMTFTMYGALAGFFFLLIVFLQQSAGYTSIQAGLATIPATVLLLLFSGRMGMYMEKYGPRIFMTLGPIISGLGILTLVNLPHASNYIFNVFPGVFLFGVGLTIFVAPLTATVMKSVPERDSGIASGINNAVSRAAGLIVVALLGLFGASNAYVFGTLLCAGLAIFAGIASFFFIRNKTT
jgi:EmrB/QacA subfamily drug resistance transporter